MGGHVGRLAPTPTGYLHAGHAATFFCAWKRARESGGHLILRIEDLDSARCKSTFSDAAVEDLRWLGLDWDEGPVFQSHRRGLFRQAWENLRDSGRIYACSRSRRELAARAPHAPHEDEPVFPFAWRGSCEDSRRVAGPEGWNWRFQVPDGEEVIFEDAACGRVSRVAGRDFGDFLVWNRDNIPAYELAVVVDDHAMGVTEIVRGRDLLTSTARQILLARALGWSFPSTFHCPLVCDENGRRLAKREGSQSVRELRARGLAPGEIFEIGNIK